MTISKESQKSIQRHLGIGLLLVAVVIGGAGGWASTTEISGAVVAPGSVVVDGDVKKVQHRTGGVVGEILVRDGDTVDAGDVLFRLDATVADANLGIIKQRLMDLHARRTRLLAERDGLTSLAFPADLQAQYVSDINPVLNAERKLFDLRRQARVGQKSQLRQRIGQLGSEIEGLAAQLRAKEREIAFIGRELESARGLYAKQLMSIAKLTLLERQATRLEGERGQLVTSIASVKGRITETELQILQIDRDAASEVAKALSQVEASLGEYEERLVAAADQRARLEVRAPRSGIVHKSSVATVGGVVGAGETAMLIVPTSEKLTIEARVAPNDIDQLRMDQRAVLRFSAFNQNTTPELNGMVRHIAADVTHVERTSQRYYEVRVEVDAGELKRLGGFEVKPGMPVEVFVKTEKRKVLSYLVKPIQDQTMRAFRED